MFNSMGAAVFDDLAASWAHYGGVISGVDSVTGNVRLWAPSYGRFARGAIINLGQGSGGNYDINKNFIAEVNVQKTHTALVRSLCSLSVVVQLTGMKGRARAPVSAGPRAGGPLESP